VSLDEATTARLKREAVEGRGVSAVLSGGGLLAIIGGAVILGNALFAARGVHAPAWLGTVALVIGLAAAVVGGVLHQRRYKALASAVGLSDAEAKALSEQADEEQDN